MKAIVMRLVLIQKAGEMPLGTALGDIVEVKLEYERHYTLGQQPNVDIWINASGIVGRIAARFTATREGLWFMDTGSGGGSSIEMDGAVEHRPHRIIRDGAILRVGRKGTIALRIELPGDPSSIPTVVKEPQSHRLFDAVWALDLDAVQGLLRDGYDPAVERDGLTPLHLAAVNGFTDAAGTLIRAGARVDAEAWPDLACFEWSMIARKKWASDPLLLHQKWIEECPPTTTRDEWWRTVSSRTRRDFIGENEQGALGCTPLHLACDGGQSEMVSLLLAHGADPYLDVYLDGGPEGFWSWTPLTLAREKPSDRPHSEVLAVLERYMLEHPQSEDSRARSEKRYQLIPQ